MVKNNFEKDIAELCIIKRTNKTKLAERCGELQQNLVRDVRRTKVSNKYVKYCEELGYDIEIMYVER